MSKKHTGFWVTVDGQPAHVYGDINMSQKTMNALAHVIQAAYKAVDEGQFDNDDDKICTRCGEYETSAPDGVCGHCKIEDLRKIT